MLLPPFELHWQARTECSRFRTLSPTSRPASMNRWCFLARTRPPSRIPILAARPPLAAWSCKPNSGTLTPGLNAMGSCSQKIAGRFTASGQTIVMGKRRSCRQNGPSYDDRVMPVCQVFRPVLRFFAPVRPESFSGGTTKRNPGAPLQRARDE